MKLDLFNNKYKPSNVTRIIFADIVCFLLVAIFSVGFCYAYFSGKNVASGSMGLAQVTIEYRKDAGDASSVTNIVYGNINGGTDQEIESNLLINPGDTLNIKGYAVNTSGGVGVYALARLEIITNKDSEVVWYNIQNGQPLYVERGLFQVGASLLNKNESQALSISYVFEGDRYTNQHLIQSINLTLHAHQKDYLSAASDYYNYSAVNGYSQDSIYATHNIIGRKRSVWRDADANISGLDLNSLDKDSSGAYLINTCKDWMVFEENAYDSNATNETFKLNAYLDFDNNVVDNDIGYFSGVFDGQGYTISNINIESTENFSGLFYRTENATIKNLGLDGFKLVCNYSGNETIWIGSLVASAKTTTIIENCYTIGASVYDNSVTYDINLNAPTHDNMESRIGGLVGDLRGDETTNVTSVIKNSYARLNLSANSNVAYIGGIAGKLRSTVLVENCYYNGNINSSKFGGLITAVAAATGYVNNCFAITNNFTYKYSIEIMIGSDMEGYEDYYNNLAYIDNTNKNNGDSDYNKVEKIGNNQTERNITINTIYSVGLMRDAFGWDTSVWASDIYTGNNGLLVLRKFYNF